MWLFNLFAIIMRVEFVHLSDFHIDKNFDYRGYTSKILKSIVYDKSKTMSNKIILCITGDLTKSGSKNQFQVFDQFLEYLKQELSKKEKELIIYFVPGNHDIFIPDGDERKAKVEEAILKRQYDLLLQEDLDNMNAFFEFAKKYNLFIKNKLVDNQILEIEEKKIQFNLLNTAPFSLRTKDDKEKHYIPVDLLMYDVDCVDFNITLMHHSNEWFVEECEYPLDDLLDASTFYLFGHQHKKHIIIKENSRGFLATEVNYYNLGKSTFNIYLLDIDESNLRPINVEYNELEKEYIRHKDINSRIYPLKLNKNKKYNLFYDINNKVELDNKKLNLDEIFVMPLLTLDNGEKIIVNYENLIDYINKNKFVNIQGYPRGGKSTLLRKIYNEYIKSEKYVFYLNNLSNITNNYDMSLKHIFTDNYKCLEFDGFLQEIKENKILIIDDPSILRDDKHIKFLEYCIDIFEIIVFTTDFIYENRKEIINENCINGVKKIKIEPFTMKQRQVLIQNIANIYNQGDKFLEISKCLESVINNDFFVDLTNPDNLVCLVDNLIRHRMYEERDTKDSFSVMFSHNIITKVRNNIGNREVDASLKLLENIAYKMFKKDKECYKISVNEISLIINEEKENWGYTIKVVNFLNMIRNSKLMNEENDSYQFTKNSYYSYFVAKYLTNKFNKYEEIKEDINKLTSNITFGNYGDILLFIAYLNNNDMFFENILNNINELTKDWKQVSFDKKNHYILEKKAKEGTLFQEKFENRYDHVNRIDKKEREILKKYEDEKIDDKYQKKDSDEEFNKAIKVMKLLEILSKGINGYSGIINVSQRRKMINASQSGLYKLIYKVFDFSKLEYDEVCEEIDNNETKKIEEKNKTKIDDIELPDKVRKMVINILYEAFSFFTLNVLISIANLMVSSNSITIINEIKDYDENKTLIFDNVLFKLICYERYGKQDKFVEYFMSIFKDVKNNDYRNMLLRIFRLFVITSEISVSNIEKICSTAKIDKSIILKLNPNNKEKINALVTKVKSK